MKMRISVSEAGKRFNRDWIFRNFSYQFEAPHSYAITGPNGSGKSTLLQVLSGSMQLSSGNISWNNRVNLDEGIVFNSMAIAAPYLEVVEEMTAVEFLRFHASFKPLLPQISPGEILSIVGLEKAAHKQIRYYSSGMKQRIKLAQAIFSDVPVLLLDEPCTNFDNSGYELYYQLISTYCKERLVIVSSNDEKEFSFCKERIVISDYK